MTEEPPQYRIVPFDAAAGHRTEFASGSEELDQYFQQRLSQDIKRRVASAYVGLNSNSQTVGYYTLASASIDLSELPDAQKRKLPRYGAVPAVRMGRLAVHRDHQRRGIGELLLVNALHRAYRSEIASYALLVDAKDEAAATYYRRFQFISFPTKTLTLFLPLATVRDLVEGRA